MNFFLFIREHWIKQQQAFVYFNPHAIELKKLKPLSKDDVKKAFDGENINVFDNSEEMFSYI